VNSRGDHGSACRDGHADEVLAAWTSRVLRLRILADVEARQSARPSNDEKKRDDRAELDDLVPQIRLPEFGNLMASPDP